MTSPFNFLNINSINQCFFLHSFLLIIMLFYVFDKLLYADILRTINNLIQIIEYHWN